MAKIVLVNGADQVQHIGASQPLELGLVVEVVGTVAGDLLTCRCPGGDPMFILESELDPQQIELRLIDECETFSLAGLYADSTTTLKVSASLVPYLLSKKRNGVSVFEVVAAL